jgi:hypothetical protein
VLLLLRLPTLPLLLTPLRLLIQQLLQKCWQVLLMLVQLQLLLRPKV